tara:strand:+ start:737 stop:1036 length:300 start_codon:yes stop_codon:yes gene_type:complete
MDNTLLQAPQTGDPVMKEETRSEWEQGFNSQTGDPMSGGKWNKKSGTYREAVVQPYEQALATHQNYSATAGQSQQTPSGSAFDTTLTRYSPNVAQTINF